MPRPWTVAILLAPLASAASAQTIHIAGDSTAATYKADRYPQSGWGQFLPCAVDPRISVSNHAVGGRSTKTFIEEGRLDRIRAELRPGDTLLIQFGHNDANRVKAERYAAPDGAYRTNLSHMVAVARAAGAQPVLMTPVIRRHFVAGTVRADFRPWSDSVRRLARELLVPLIDLERDSARWVQQAGEEGSRAYFLHYAKADGVPPFPNGIADDTHFSELGARGVAEIVARNLRALRLPVSGHVRRHRPDLRRTVPLGRADCH